MCFYAPEKILTIILNGSTKAINLSLYLLAVYCFWLGFLRLLSLCGLDKKIAKLLRPVNKFLFGDIPESANGYISLNFSANMLGMGGAATPLALKAIGELEKNILNSSEALIMLFVINAASIQLLPTTVMSLMAGKGSIKPAAIILPSLLSAIASTLTGIILVKTLRRRAR